MFRGQPASNDTTRIVILLNAFASRFVDSLNTLTVNSTESLVSIDRRIQKVEEQLQKLEEQVLHLEST